MRSQRGSTLIEVMIAATILLIAMLGLAAVMNMAAGANATGHRRTVGAFLREAALDRILVMPRDALATVPGSTWIIDACYDVDSLLLPGGSNDGHSTTFTCPTSGPTPVYRTWLQVVPGSGGAARTWSVHAYAERIAPGCVPEARYSSLGCVAADLLLTD